MLREISFKKCGSKGGTGSFMRWAYQSHILKISALLFILAFQPISPPFAEESIPYRQPVASYKDIQSLANALSILQFVSMGDRDAKRFLYSALSAMTEALDRYSFFVPPELIGIFSQALKDKYVGTGMCIAKTKSGNIEVISTEPDGPASKAGIKPKDVITTIDGKQVSEMSFLESLKLMIGPEFSSGSKAKLSIRREGNEEPLNFVLTREFIKPQMIEWRIPEKGYGYVRLKGFNRSTIKDFKKGIEETETKGGVLKGLIIDLRNNPGGDIEASIELSRLFIESGVIASFESNYQEYKGKFKADGGWIYRWPIVVAVDEGSASTSELFSGTLKFHKRAWIIGRRTFGKGTFQTLVPLIDDMGLYITLGRFYLPDGSSVEGSGVMPDVILDQNGDDEVVIKKALEILKSVN